LLMGYTWLAGWDQHLSPCVCGMSHRLSRRAVDWALMSLFASMKSMTLSKRFFIPSMSTYVCGKSHRLWKSTIDCTLSWIPSLKFVTSSRRGLCSSLTKAFPECWNGASISGTDLWIYFALLFTIPLVLLYFCVWWVAVPGLAFVIPSLFQVLNLEGNAKHMYALHQKYLQNLVRMVYMKACSDAQSYGKSMWTQQCGPIYSWTRTI